MLKRKHDYLDIAVGKFHTFPDPLFYIIFFKIKRNTVCKKSIRVLEIFRVQKLILNATS